MMIRRAVDPFLTHTPHTEHTLHDKPVRAPLSHQLRRVAPVLALTLLLIASTVYLATVDPWGRLSAQNSDTLLAGLTTDTPSSSSSDSLRHLDVESTDLSGDFAGRAVGELLGPPWKDHLSAKLMNHLVNLEDCLAGVRSMGLYGQHSVAVLIPFRDGAKTATTGMSRTEHLQVFLAAMDAILAPNIHYHFYIIEQSDDAQNFNIGKLKNIGFDIAHKDTETGPFDIFLFSDVDMIPDCELIPWYVTFPDQPVHLAARGTRYTAKSSGKHKAGETFFGGVASFRAEDYVAVNGFPNNYWGWGGDDDELLHRIQDLGIKVTVPSSGSVLDLEKLNVKAKMGVLASEGSKSRNRKALRKQHAETWRGNGLNSLAYKVLGKATLTPHATKITVLL